MCTRMCYHHLSFTLIQVIIMHSIKSNASFKTGSRDNGYKRYCRDATATREDYIRQLADDYGLNVNEVRAISQMFGPSEDFDGLVAMVSDYSEMAGI